MKKSIKLLPIIAALLAISACGDKAAPTINPTKNDNNNGSDVVTPVEPIKVEKTFTVTFVSNGGSNVDPIKVKESETLNKPTDPTRNGYEFAGWYINSSLTTPMTFGTKIIQDITLYAKWNELETPPSLREYTVTFVTNGGSSITPVDVKEGYKLTKPADPSRQGYTFKGWFKDVNLTTPMNFDNPISSELTLYAKWEKIIADNNYGIVDRDTKIPTNIEFSGETHTSANHTVINCSSLPSSGSFNQNFDGMSDATTVNGIKLLKYKYNKNSGSLVLLADNTYYSNTPYHGREGTIFNVDPIGGINEITVSYSASYSSTQNLGYSFSGDEIIKPNIRFGNDPSCTDYVYFLNPSSNSDTCNVNLSGYQYFSVCSGTYNLTLNTITVDYDNNATSSPTYAATSGDGKVRINPTRYTYSLVPGESKITVPLETEYNESANTYTVTKSKELTYYTLNYVNDHPECKNDAAIIDPLLIASYYTAFKKFPANFEIKNNMYRVRDAFGDKARQVSTYDRTDGYVRAVPWGFQGKYHEFDIDIDNTYSSSRGSGRVVAWDSGWSGTGYDDSPVCIYTDDHYNTFIEYLNNGTWSNRFNAEGFVAGTKYSTASTVSLTGFNPNMVQGTNGGGDIGGGDIGGGGSGGEGDTVNDNDYYANFAPVELINDKTAKFQQVTNVSGINDENTYIFAAPTESNQVYPYQDGLNYNSASNYYDFDNDYNREHMNKMFFEPVSSNTGYMYRFYNGDKTYVGFNESERTKSIINKKVLFNFSFDEYGNFVLGSNNYYLRYNQSAASDPYRFYGANSQKPIRLYRYCDIEGAVAPSYTFKEDSFSLINNTNQINEEDEYLIVSEKYKKSPFGNGDYIVDKQTKELKVTEDSYYDRFTLEKHSVYDLYAIKFPFLYIGYSSLYEGNLYIDYVEEPVYFKVEFNDGILKIIPMDVSGSTPTPVLIDGKECFLRYDGIVDNFVFTTNDSKLDTRLYKYEKTIHIVYNSVYSMSSIDDDTDLILVSKEGKCCLTDNTDTIYDMDYFGQLVFEGTPNYKVMHFIKNEPYDVYSIAFEDYGGTRYVCIDEDSKEIYYSSEPSSYYKINIYGDGSVNIALADYLSDLNQYEIISYRSGYYYLKYNPEEGKFMLCNYSTNTYEYLFEVSSVLS
ncbi:MAG: InlB B-repeat-containing protein [Bacilli bacterium]|nr:InlB B-repeat-containing protein [Bacilli bacterium]